MDKETIKLIEQAFLDGFSAGEAYGRVPSCLGSISWLFWRAINIDLTAYTRGEASPDLPNIQNPEEGTSQVCTNS